MRFDEFLVRVIGNGIEAAKADYSKPGQEDKLRGSLAGFEACRGKDPAQLLELLQEASRATQEAHRERVSNYWEIRCREAEIEWVCNVVSAVLANQGMPVIVQPTCRGVLAADRVLQGDGCVIVRDERPDPGVGAAMSG